jgi:hypothetical protein
MGVKVTTHIRLVTRLRMSGNISLIPLYAFVAWRGNAFMFLSLYLWIADGKIKDFGLNDNRNFTRLEFPT